MSIFKLNACVSCISIFLVPFTSNSYRFPAVILEFSILVILFELTQVKLPCWPLVPRPVIPTDPSANANPKVVPSEFVSEITPVRSLSFSSFATVNTFTVVAVFIDNCPVVLRPTEYTSPFLFFTYVVAEPVAISEIFSITPVFAKPGKFIGATLLVVLLLPCWL